MNEKARERSVRLCVCDAERSEREKRYVREKIVDCVSE